MKLVINTLKRILKNIIAVIKQNVILLSNCFLREKGDFKKSGKRLSLTEIIFD